MKCTDALEFMLDAEPSELAERGTTPLATHIATCRRCRAVAQQLAGDTRLLSVSVLASAPAGPVRRGSALWIQRSLAPAGLVAALLLALARTTPDAPVRTDLSPPSIAVRDSVATPRVVDAAPIPVERVRPRPGRAYPAPIPVAAVRIDAPPRSIAPALTEDGPAIVVDAPAGQRVAVMRTSNPKFIVVWLY